MEFAAEDEVNEDPDITELLRLWASRRPLWPEFEPEILPPNSPVTEPVISAPSQLYTSELRLVLLGDDWRLKELVGNLLLGNTKFDLFTHWNKCVKVSGTFQDKPVTVIYTPDQLLSSTSQNFISRIKLLFSFTSQHQQFIQDIKALSAPGPHVFLLVLQPEHFTEEDKSRLQSVLESLREQVFHHSLVLMIWSHLDGKKPEDHMPKPHIKDLISRCKDRYMWIDIDDDLKCSDPNNKVREKLFSRICDILKKNDGAHLTLDPSEEKDTGLRITLIGKTGSGKSSSANTILGIKTFTAKPSQRPVTTVCQRELTTYDGRRVAVVDTPGLFDTNMTNAIVDVERFKCISLLAPGPHVFLMVLQFGRFTGEERKTFELIKKAFGEGVVKFMIILFTHGDQLERFKMSVEEFIKDTKKSEERDNQEHDNPLQQLLSECGNRFHVFDNCNRLNRTQVTDLLKKIDELVEKNRGEEYYTNDMLLQAEAATKREMERKIKEMEGKIKDMESERKEMEGKMKEMEGKIKEIETKFEQRERKERESEEREREKERREKEKERREKEREERK